MLHHIETSRLICFASQSTGFYMMATLAFNELIKTVDHSVLEALAFALALNK